MKPSDSQAALIQWGIELETRLPAAASVPGTGVGYRSSGKGCLILLAALPAGMTAFWLTTRYF